ncbi:SDR family oxidoreductase [Mesorhizobium sp. BAC0120]|uniref:SDR family oxidoreductase n=1 Tax=Mesorhizobium sp. BAC0120 TaxID=3090670 RepID=UPI00298C2E81|nr:SDR family oxidoreductase [Mesorhizobium sp. BAC0120]MDW6025832.1 SDR family oxidoreductase [Mesorhizobium sp. BAC0120]
MSYPLFSLDGRLALVTGSARGIGLALARGLAEHGAPVVVNARTASDVADAAASISSAGHKAYQSLFDVTDARAVEAEVDRIEREIGPIEILFNNAGIQHRAPLEEFPDDKFQSLLQINIAGVFNVGKAVARRMIPRRRGKIINIASVQSELARTNIAPYTATKGAVRNLTRGMCTDWAKYGLQINAIAPGYFRTPLNKALLEDQAFNAWLEQRTPARRWADPQELVGAAVFLASDASSFVNGHTLYVDGGITASL